jgi:CDP-glucose 4,6-dehydratase
VENLGLDPSFWRGRRVLLTGHTGFKGAWLALWLETLGAEVTALALPAEPESLRQRLEPFPVAHAATVDVRDSDTLSACVRSAAPDVVLHLAAQALVRRGYRDPAATFATNIQGTVNLLEALRLVDPVKAILVVTSDKVYLHKSSPDGFQEDDALGGSDPYSASKAACEMVVSAYRAPVFAPKGIAIATARAGNVVGGGDVGEDRLLPDLVRAINSGQALRLRAPSALRPWLHVLDALGGYLTFVQKMATRPQDVPATLNFGPEAESRRTAHEVVETARALWGKEVKIEAGTSLPVELEPLWLATGRAVQTLGWRPRLDFDAAIRWTVDWWKGLAHGQSARTLCMRQIGAYLERAR